jgi:hypothetical protein
MIKREYKFFDLNRPFELAHLSHTRSRCTYSNFSLLARSVYEILKKYFFLGGDLGGDFAQIRHRGAPIQEYKK